MSTVSKIIVLITLFLNSYLIIPSIDLYKNIEVAPFKEGTWDTDQLEYGVARLEGTAWGNNYLESNGHYGRTVLIGHNPGAFSYLHLVSVGDEIIILPEYSEKPLTYTVYASYHESDITNAEWLVGVSQFNELVLITCEGQGRRIVKAYLND